MYSVITGLFPFFFQSDVDDLNMKQTPGLARVCFAEGSILPFVVLFNSYATPSLVYIDHSLFLGYVYRC